MQIKITTKHRVLCLILTSLGILGYIISLVLMLNFIIDSEYFDNYRFFNRLNKNKVFNLCDFYNCEGSNKMKYFINIILLGALWYYQLNHYAISKRIFFKFPNFKYLIKSLYAVINSLLNIQLIIFWQPINTPFFNFENYFILGTYSFLFWACITIHFLSLSVVKDSDLLGWSILKSVLFQDEIKYPKNIRPKFSWLYRACRHPMQGSYMGLMLFSSAYYSYGKILFIILHSIGIWLGILVDEVSMYNHEELRKYIFLVENRFIPDLLNSFSYKIEKILNGDQ